MKTLPPSFRIGLIRWRVTVNRPGHFRAEARPSLRGASRDAKAMLACGGLFLLAGTLLALGAGWAGLDALGRVLRYGPHPAAVREALLFLTVALGWLGLLYLLAPKVWVLEARPGVLRFGPRVWTATQVQAVAITQQRGETTTYLDPDYLLATRSTYALTDFHLRLADGRRQRVWRVSGRARHAAEAWVRHMAAVAGVTVEG